jgi:hypothetical protein
VPVNGLVADAIWRCNLQVVSLLPARECLCCGWRLTRQSVLRKLDHSTREFPSRLFMATSFRQVSLFKFAQIIKTRKVSVNLPFRPNTNAQQSLVGWLVGWSGQVHHSLVPKSIHDIIASANVRQLTVSLSRGRQVDLFRSANTCNFLKRHF